MTELDLPPAVFKTCPWQPRTLVETGLRQWLRCCAPALQDNQVIGMPSRAVDEACHGLILCTARYAAFCDTAYGQFLHTIPRAVHPRLPVLPVTLPTSNFAGQSLPGSWPRSRTNKVCCGTSTNLSVSNGPGVSAPLESLRFGARLRGSPSAGAAYLVPVCRSEPMYCKNTLCKAIPGMARTR
ncbi:MAG: hypothetical protein QOD58_3162, partial [Mycobacterium sp.]|nr:hypothetical protein [Mycobacterium sp.]